MRILHLVIAFVGSFALQIGLASWTSAGAPTGQGTDEEAAPVNRTGPFMKQPRSRAFTAARSRGIAPAESALFYMSGDIEAYLKAIEYGAADDGLWTLPSSVVTSIFTQALALMFAGAYEQAALEAERIEFQLIEYTDPVRGVRYILQDTPNADNIIPGGTYVWNPRALYPMVVEVPHPRYDSNTNHEGIELFLASESALLVLSGTHRRSDALLTTCDGASSNDYRRSDPAHAEAHLFHAAHAQAEDSLHEPLFIQLHGFGAAAYDQLKRECKHRTKRNDPALLVNVSDGYKDSSGTGAPPAGSFARILHDTINDDRTIKSCLYNEDTLSYGGTVNVQGRYTNGSLSPCTTNAARQGGRFIHLEQSYNTRRYERALLIALIQQSLQIYYGSR